jgi:carbon-monoxide dehydrogenase small subunit
MTMPHVERVPLSVTVNGKPYDLEIEPRLLLVDLLRDELHLTGTHVGCDSSYCGACTVLLDGRSVKSCTVLAVQAHGAELTTVEGLATNDELHPVQKAFAENHGLQCGYCTPGLLLSAIDLLSRHPHPSDAEIRKAIAGNTCRCTGYQNILKAIRAAAQAHGPR